MTKRKTQTYRGISFIHPKPYDEEDRYWNQYAPTLKQFRNLIDMAHAIQNSPPPAFDMSNYGSVDTNGDNEFLLEKYDSIGYSGDVHDPITLNKLRRYEDVNICGTSACAIGTAAFHGVGRLTQGMSWNSYSVETFDLMANQNLWEWLFSSAWYSVDNTPEGAVARILMLVTEGPEAVDKRYPRCANILYEESAEREEMKASYQKYVGIKVS